VLNGGKRDGAFEDGRIPISCAHISGQVLGVVARHQNTPEVRSSMAMVDLSSQMTLLDGENGVSAMSRNSFMYVSTSGHLQLLQPFTVR
jgi:hypothetical protein